MGGASLNMSLKSGTNTPHGQIYYFMQNPVFTADKYFRLAAGKPQFRLYRWGGNVSGPVVIPKLYNGRTGRSSCTATKGSGASILRRGWWKRCRRPRCARAISPVCWRSARDTRSTIRTPSSPRPTDGSAASRCRTTSFPRAGSIRRPRRSPRCGTRRTRPGTVDGTNNYTKGKNAQDTYWNHIVRIDHNVSEKQRFYVRTNFTDLQRPENIRHNLAVGDNFFRYNKGFAVDDVYTISPRFFVNARYTLTRFITGNDTVSGGFRPGGARLLLDVHQSDQRQSIRAYYKLPNINVTGYSSLGGVSPRNSVATDIHEAAVNFTSMLGAHTLRYGFAYRIYRRNNFNLGNSAGTLNFDTTWTRGPLDNSRRGADGPELRAVPLRHSRAAASSPSTIPTPTSPRCRRCSSRTTGRSAASSP